MIKCNLCHEEINLSKDNYVKVTDYKRGNFFMENYYHNKCYNDVLAEIKLNRQKLLVKSLDKLLVRADQLVEKQEELSGVKKEKVYHFT